LGPRRAVACTPRLGWNADAVVADADLDTFAELAGRNSQLGAKSAVDLAAAPGHGIDAVAAEVEQHAADIL